MPLKFKLWLGKLFAWNKRDMRMFIVLVVAPCLVVIAIIGYSVADNWLTPDPELSSEDEQEIERAIPDDIDLLIDRIINDSLRDHEDAARTTPSPGQ